MTYAETVSYLFSATPLFQHVGASAYKPGLQTTEALDAHLGHPHRRFHTIHVAGTNGKGSCCHTLAAILHAAGYRVGLYTSPHLLDFRERIRVDGEMVPEDYVVSFVARHRAFFEPLHPSFFELATDMAFSYFADAEVDVAVIEVGLGGRLDCTNIIRPLLSLITNISLDHTQQLGSTLAAIAREKAGIIKAGVPAVVGETLPETRPVFEAAARTAGAPLTFADDAPEVVGTAALNTYATRHFGTFRGELTGEWQMRNTNTLLCALRQLPLDIPLSAVHQGFARVSRTGLVGRWQTLQERPRLIIDTGHNAGGWQYLGKRLEQEAEAAPLHIVLGMAADKDVAAVLHLLPRTAHYYWAQASTPRALSADVLAQAASATGLSGGHYPTVGAAYAAARAAAAETDTIFVGGSNFVVADLLQALT